MSLGREIQHCWRPYNGHYLNNTFLDKAQLDGAAMALSAGLLCVYAGDSPNAL